MLHSNIHLYNILLKCVDILSHTVNMQIQRKLLAQSAEISFAQRAVANVSALSSTKPFNTKMASTGSFIIQLQVPFYQPQVPCSNLYPPSLHDFQDFPDITLVHDGW